LTAKPPTLPIRLFIDVQEAAVGAEPGVDRADPAGLADRVLPSRVSEPSGAIEKREIAPDPVFTVNRNWPSWVISIQHGAICLSANGDAPIEVSVPSWESVYAEMVPLSGAVLWALETNSWSGLVGRNSLPNGPRPWAVNGDPGALVSRPSKPTVKLSISEVPTSVPIRLVPVPLNRTSAGAALEASETVDPGIENRRPLNPSRKPV